MQIPKTDTTINQAKHKAITIRADVADRMTDYRKNLSLTPSQINFVSHVITKYLDEQEEK